MKIDRISQLFGIDLQKAAGTSKSTEKSEKPAKGDSVLLSKKGKELQAHADESVILSQLKNMPDVRPERVQDAKEKVASGYFDTPEFMDRLADRLMKEFGFKGP